MKIKEIKSKNYNLCNQQLFSLENVALIVIQGVFLTGTPPKNSKYKKFNLG